MVAVYILKTKGGKIIYVGCSGSPMARFLQHRPKGWLHLVSDIKLKWYPTRNRAEKAEARFIRRFRPRYNVQHNPDYQAKRVPLHTLGRYIPRKPVAHLPKVSPNEWGGRTFGVTFKPNVDLGPDLPKERVYVDKYGEDIALQRVLRVMRENDSLRVLGGYHMPEWALSQAAQCGLHIEPTQKERSE